MATSCFLATEVPGSRTGAAGPDAGGLRVAAVTARSSRTPAADPYSERRLGYSAAAAEGERVLARPPPPPRSRSRVGGPGPAGRPGPAGAPAPPPVARG